MDRELIQSEHAFIARQYRWAGCPDECRIASFRGDIMVPVEQIKPTYWRYNRCSRELLFSSYHLSEDTIDKYLTRLNEYDPELIYAYPSFIYLIARYAKKRGFDISLPSLRGIVTSSETLFEYQKNLTEAVFHTRVFNWYGLSERVAFIGTCEYGGHHVFPDYGLTEFIPFPEAEQQGLFELVGTSFINKVTPLIRYRTGDVVTLISEPCECGRSFSRVKSILGRSNDAIVTPEGRVIVMVDDVFKNIENIKLAQIVQKKIDEIDILVEAEATFNISDENRIVKNMRLRIGEKINISVTRVKKIPRMPNNKYKLTVSSLSDINRNTLSHP
jgi:phenylacetate-CoA ligase